MGSLPPMPPSLTREAFVLSASDFFRDLHAKLGWPSNMLHVREAEQDLASLLAEMYFHVHPRVKHLQPVKVSLPERDPMQDILIEAGYELLRLRQDERCQQMGGGG